MNVEPTCHRGSTLNGCKMNRKCGLKTLSLLRVIKIGMMQNIAGQRTFWLGSRHHVFIVVYSGKNEALAINSKSFIPVVCAARHKA